MKEKKALLRLLALTLLLALLPALPALGEETRTFVLTSQWEPPVIDPEEVINTEPWLLALKVAQGEVGYVEGPGKDESKYGTWFANRNVAWCAKFLTWCARKADTTYGTSLHKVVYPHYGKPDEGFPWFREHERYVTASDRVPVTLEKQWLIGDSHYLADNEYIPWPGDYLWISYYLQKATTDHVAIVEGVSINDKGEYIVHVIEGNNPDRVQRAQYPLTYGKIHGYGLPIRRANRVVRLYDTAGDIVPIQRYLVGKGFLKSVNSKVFERKAVEAVRAYQKANKLRKTGMVDYPTRTCMEKDSLFQQIMQEYSPR